MAAVWFGVILIIFSVVLQRFHTETSDKWNLRPWAWAARVFALLFIIGGMLASTIVMVPAGTRGVLLRFQAVQGILPEGINFVLPYINSVEVIEVRTQKEESSASAASKDMQIVTTSLALNFHLDPSKVGDLYKKVGTTYKMKVIDPAVQESIKMVTAKFTAEELIKQRAAVKSEVESDISRRLRAYDIIVEPGGLSITNFNFSPEFNNAIEAKQVAQQEAEQQKYVLQKAELERQTMVAKAKGASEAAKLNAQALQAQGGSKVLTREWIEKWDGHLPNVAGSGSGMILDINSLMNQGK
ncbi:MAG TPA: prohibitin family protein [Armatimonadota bacterium]|jgi:regulator of protease activity HflC (stomatin/prohibitin superfamily)